MTKAANLASLGSNASTTGILPIAGGGTAGTNGAIGFKNRIINGAMMIDQRGAGASYNPTGGAVTYGSVDRWSFAASQANKFTAQQNAGSVTPPAGFTNYLGITSSSAYTVGSGEEFDIRQAIEGYSVADFGWGTANAATVTLSFWVRSSLTGTFGGSLKNSASNRSYPFTYTISSANTWEQKSITVAGDTSGTWVTNNGVGIYLNIGLGVGSTYSGTAGAWASANYISATGATSVVGTNGATFYLTGVQLEVGTTATNFDFRSYGQELALCQRYYEKAPSVFSLVSYAYFTNDYYSYWAFKVTKRASPTVTAGGTWSGDTSAAPTPYSSVDGSWLNKSSKFYMNTSATLDASAEL